MVCGVAETNGTALRKCISPDDDDDPPSDAETSGVMLVAVYIFAVSLCK